MMIKGVYVSVCVCVYICLGRTYIFDDGFDVGCEGESWDDPMVFYLGNFQRNRIAVSWDREDSPRSRFSEWVSEWVKGMENEGVLIENAALWLYHSDFTNDNVFLSLTRPL